MTHEETCWICGDDLKEWPCFLSENNFGKPADDLLEAISEVERI